MKYRMSRYIKAWRESSTVILTAPTARHIFKGKNSTQLNDSQSSPIKTKAQPGCDISVLMLVRSAKSKFMPNTSVFPGGAISKHDFEARWGDLMNKSINWRQIEQWKLHRCEESQSRPELYTKTYEWEDDLPNEVALRICGIRETFEESGILLSKPLPDSEINSVSPEVMNAWQDEVNKDASKFYDMCVDLKVVPNVWSLYDWSNWLTPLYTPFNPGSGIRFDTMFYMVCLPEIVQQVHDHKEIISAKWMSVPESLQRCYDQEISLPPPQIYELGRLMNYNDLGELDSYAKHRASQGCHRLYPVQVNFQDGVSSVLPGDSIYPGQPDLYGDHPVIEMEGKLTDNDRESSSLNRFNFSYGTNDDRAMNYQLLCNLNEFDGHKNPGQSLSRYGVFQRSYVKSNK